jgi:hypothetical protein
VPPCAATRDTLVTATELIIVAQGMGFILLTVASIEGILVKIAI